MVHRVKKLTVKKYKHQKRDYMKSLLANINERDFRKLQ